MFALHLSVSRDLCVPEEGSADRRSHSEAPRAAAQNFLHHSSTVTQQFLLDFFIRVQFNAAESSDSGFIKLNFNGVTCKVICKEGFRGTAVITLECENENIDISFVFVSPPASTSSAPQHQTTTH